MDPILRPIKNLFADMNYVYMVELLVILSITCLLLYIFYALGLFRKKS